MSAATGAIPPPVSWAQRQDLVYVVIDVECKDIEHKVTENTFHFKGINTLEPTKKYDVTLNFYEAVDPERVTSKNIGRCLEFTIYKKVSGPYWPRLTKEKNLHFLKTNFSKWKNESDDEDEMAGMGGLGGLGGLGGMGYDNLGDMSAFNNKFDDFNVDDADDDDSDDLPELQKEDEDDDVKEGDGEGGDGEDKKKEEASSETK